MFRGFEEILGCRFSPLSSPCLHCPCPLFQVGPSYGLALLAGPGWVSHRWFSVETPMELGLDPHQPFDEKGTMGRPVPPSGEIDPPLSEPGGRKNVRQGRYFDPLPASSLTQSTSENDGCAFLAARSRSPGPSPQGSPSSMVRSMHVPQRILALSGGTDSTSRQIAPRTARQT